MDAVIYIKPIHTTCGYLNVNLDKNEVSECGAPARGVKYILHANRSDVTIALCPDHGGIEQVFKEAEKSWSIVAPIAVGNDEDVLCAGVMLPDSRTTYAVVRRLDAVTHRDTFELRLPGGAPETITQDMDLEKAKRDFATRRLHRARARYTSKDILELAAKVEVRPHPGPKQTEQWSAAIGIGSLLREISTYPDSGRAMSAALSAIEKEREAQLSEIQEARVSTDWGMDPSLEDVKEIFLEPHASAWDYA